MHRGWKRTTLGDVADFRNGLNFLRGDRGYSVKVVGVGDFQQHETLADFSETATVTIANRITDDDLLEDDDLLFVRSNGNKALVGRCVLISGIKEPVTFSGFTIRARVKSLNVDHSYLSKLVRSPLFLEHLHRRGGGSSINNLSQDALSAFSFGLPPLSEQRKIAELLRTWDAALDKLAALRACRQARLTGLTQRLIGSGGVFPSKWQLKPLSGIATRVRRQNDGGNHPIMTISAKYGFLMQSEKFARDMAGSSVDRYTLLLGGEFAYNKGNSLTAPYGCIYRLDQPSAVIPFVYFCFALKSGLEPSFYEHLFSAGALNHQLSRLINSGVRNDGLLNLDSDDFFACKVPVPPLEDQQRIAVALSSAKKELALLDEEIAALTRQKRGLMQKLLTGEWRVNVPEKEGAAA
jgi:type I restriction enzyme S subunit